MGKFALHKCCASLGVCGQCQGLAGVNKDLAKLPESVPGLLARQDLRFGDSLQTATCSLPYSTGMWAKCHSAGRRCGMQHGGVRKQRWGLFKHTMRKHQRGLF